MLVSWILAVILIILAVFFASNNLSSINIDLFGYAFHGPIGLLMVSSLGAGVLLGILLMLPAIISRSWALLRHKRKLQDMQDNMPAFTPGDPNEV